MDVLHAIKRSVVESNYTFDPHTEPHYDVTAGQLTFCLIWTISVCLWVFKYKTSEGGTKNSTDCKSNSDTHKSDNVCKNGIKKESIVDIETGKIQNDDNKQENSKTETENETKRFCSVRPPPSTESFLKNVSIFGLIMFYFYLCDYRKIFPKLERVYDRDEFLFLVFLLFLVACAFTISKTQDKILNRDQTEEWKGWMQVMFVWYHVFAAKEWYNWIRVYIAAYVWMTGFGNFSFFWVRKDFSLLRFLKMQFRLNFLVTCLCVVTSNEYMLYYICAMHSYWFVSVYVFMGTLKSWNNDSKKMFLKLCIYFIVNCVLFDMPGVASVIFKPFNFILGYTDPRFDSMHEWVFRAGLDHWACFFGMLCAYNYPHFENFMKNLEKCENASKRWVTKILMVITCITALVTWYKCVMEKDKYAYNTLHPYTSIIPILCFIILRNLFPIWRTHYIGMFAWLGKITLETYLSQLHIYLQSNAKHLIGYIPKYHLLNFAMATIIYLPISYVLFNLTTEFSSYLLPHDMKKVSRNALYVLLAFFVPYVGFCIGMYLL